MTAGRITPLQLVQAWAPECHGDLLDAVVERIRTDRWYRQAVAAQIAASPCSQSRLTRIVGAR